MRKSITRRVHLPCEVFGNECVVVKNVQLRAFFPPSGFLGERHRHQIVLLDAVLYRFQHQRAGFVQIRSRGRAAQA